MSTAKCPQLISDLIHVELHFRHAQVLTDPFGKGMRLKHGPGRTADRN